MRFFHWIDAMLQPQPPARLRVPHALVSADWLDPVPPPELLQEEVDVQGGLIAGDAEPKEDLQHRLVGHPDPCLSTSNLSQTGASLWTHDLIASWDLCINGSRILDAPSNCLSRGRHTPRKESGGGMSLTCHELGMFHEAWKAHPKIPSRSKENR